MLVSLWSAKGGAGVSVTAALLAMRAGQRDPEGVVLVDLRGDQPLVFGSPRGDGAGLTDWMGDRGRSPAGLVGRATELVSGVSLLPKGRAPWSSPDAVDEAVTVLGDHPSPVVVDAGCLVGDASGAEVGRRFAAVATRSILVTRACYLTLARCGDLPVVPSGVVLLREPDRALTAVDVEVAVGAPVVATIDVDPAVARAVDAGLLTGRLPRGLQRALDAVA